MKSLLRLFGSYLLSVRFRPESRKRIPLFWLAMTAPLFVPPVTHAQKCSGNINTGCLHPGAVCKPVDSGIGPSGHCMTPSGLPPGERECNCVGTPAPPPPLLDPGCGNRAITGKIKCTIDQPNVKQHETPYPTVLFAPKDVVEVTADGCVQTGGHGNTWKRYVNPSGPESNTKYHGLIRIPTGTKDSALVRINTLIGKQLTVTGAGVDLSQLELHLGYEDSDYSDNGYYSHDDGTDDQCKIDPTHGKDGGPAHVTITIFRQVPADTITSRFDFDVLSNSTDPNGLPYNPFWSWQLKPGNQGQKPDTSMCHNFSTRGSTLGVPDEFMSPSFADCTDQADSSSVDEPIEINGTLCRYATIPYFGDTFSGHVNWFPVTMEGQAHKVDHGDVFPFGDDDYTFTFTSDLQGNPLSVNGRDGLHIEFDSDETVDNFSSDEWKQFHDAVDAAQTAAAFLAECAIRQIQCNDAQKAAWQKQIDFASTLFTGHSVLTGMFGLDGEHGMKAELHPLYALALLRDNFENAQQDQAWLIFVRNQGDEGYCSSDIWDSGFEDYTFRLPWLAGMTSVDVNWGKSHFVGTDGTSGPTVAAQSPSAAAASHNSPPAGVYVTFHLGPAVHTSFILDPGASVPFINGALHLVWTGTPLTHLPVGTIGTIGTIGTTRIGTLQESKPTTPGKTGVVIQGPVATAPLQQVEVDEVEQAIGAAIKQLPPQQQKQVVNARTLAGTKTAVVHPLPSTGAVRTITGPQPIARTGKLHAIKGGPATRKMARDAAQMKALCAASNNAPAGLPKVCATAVPHP